MPRTSSDPSRQSHDIATAPCARAGSPGRRRPGWLQILRTHARAYLVINGVVYGTVVLGLLLGASFPAVTAAATAAFAGSAANGLVHSVVGNGWAFAATIFLVNVFPTALLQITLPSLLIPFAGLVLFTLNSLRLGILLAPVDTASALTLIPHSLTMLVEFQAYVLVMLGAYVLGRSWIRPASVGASTRRRGYVRGLAQLGRLWLPALALLVVGAVYEVLEIYYLVPLVRGS